MNKHQIDEFMHRDIIDICRMALSRISHASLLQLSFNLEQWRSSDYSADKIKSQLDSCEKHLDLLGQILSQHPDFSLYNSLVKLENYAPINPHSEQTLKGNTENAYCHSFYSEFFPTLYLPEFKLYEKWILEKLDNDERSPFVIDDNTFKDEHKKIKDIFYSTPLEASSPKEYSLAKLNEIINFFDCNGG